MPSTAIVTVTCLNAMPSKPPRHAYRCTLTVSAPKAGANWALLPGSLDHPLTDTMPVTSIYLRTDAAGQVFLQADDDPGFVAFRMPADGQLRIAGWELSAFSRLLEGEIWLVSDVRLTSGDTLCGLAAGPLTPPVDLPRRPAVLAEWIAPVHTTAVVMDPVRVTFRIAPGTA